MPYTSKINRAYTARHEMPRGEDIPTIAIWLDESECPVVACKLPWRHSRRLAASSLVFKTQRSAKEALSRDCVPNSEVDLGRA